MLTGTGTNNNKGGAIIAEDNTALTIYNCSFSFNRAWRGGAIQIFCTDTSITNSLFESNGGDSTTYGGAIDMQCEINGADIPVTISNSYFRNNEANMSPGKGGAICGLGTFIFSLKDSYLYDNEAKINDKTGKKVNF